MTSKEDLDYFYSALQVLETKEEYAALFDDLCTPQELRAIAQRLHVAKLLNEKRIYKDIVQETGASTATVSRVNKTLNYQTAGGYEKVFERLANKS